MEILKIKHHVLLTHRLPDLLMRPGPIPVSLSPRELTAQCQGSVQPTNPETTGGGLASGLSLEGAVLGARRPRGPCGLVSTAVLGDSFKWSLFSEVP